MLNLSLACWTKCQCFQCSALGDDLDLQSDAVVGAEVETAEAVAAAVVIVAVVAAAVAAGTAVEVDRRQQRDLKDETIYKRIRFNIFFVLICTLSKHVIHELLGEVLSIRGRTGLVVIQRRIPVILILRLQLLSLLLLSCLYLLLLLLLLLPCHLLMM
jgi:hypothetical protein